MSRFCATNRFFRVAAQTGLAAALLLLTACGGGGGSGGGSASTTGGGVLTTSGSGAPTVAAARTVTRQADADGNGLIEISTLAELNNVRYNLAGTSYRAGPGATPNTSGCPGGVCRGYELTANLNFDRDGDGSTWVRGSDGSLTLDAGDSHAGYFNTAAGGWVPIGDCGVDGFCDETYDNRPFAATFDGGGHTISGLATAHDHRLVGLFGNVGAGADIRNLGLVGNLAKYTGTPDDQNYGAAAGSFTGWQEGGSITACHATGRVEGNDGIDFVGGLVGGQAGGSITASHATGNADGGDGRPDSVGGLVGYQEGGSITASYATGSMEGGDGNDDSVGGLVGWQAGGSITASYATGNADGGLGNEDDVGGLVGYQNGGVTTASYATGNADGGVGSSDSVGVLVGRFSSGDITASWGFGTPTGQEIVGLDGRSDRPRGVTSAVGLTSANVPASWNAAASRTLGAWDFGTATQAPTLNYADYDGVIVGIPRFYTDGHLFHCTNDVASAPAGAIIIPNCALLPGIAAANVVATTADINIVSDTAGTAYVVVLADGASTPTAAAVKAAVLEGGAGSGGVVSTGSMTVVTDARVTVNLAGLMGDTSYDVYIVVESGDGTFGTVTKVDVDTLRVADADGNGLIEIGSLAELNNVRYSLDGIGYRVSYDAVPNTSGCPAGRCRGYELTADLDFDRDRDGSTWVRNGDGSFTLDAGDSHPDYFDTAAGGWVPIGDNFIPFIAVFDGAGHTISGLATVRDLGYIGLFGKTAGADIRNIGLVGNLAKHTGTTSQTHVGGLVGDQESGSIIASYATGDVGGGGGSYDYVGGLVGRCGLVGGSGGSITASYATGDVGGGAGSYDYVGGLVGGSGGSTTASYATGDVGGGGGSYDYVGGLVGGSSGSTTASYATGRVEGGDGDADEVGGLIGEQAGGSITASYAIGEADGGEGIADYAGTLVATISGSGAITASWGFGSAIGERDNLIGSSNRPASVTSASGLTSANVPASWNAAASRTLGAWNFGTATQAPALNYADYDGATVGTAPSYTSGHSFHCANDVASAPAGAIIIPHCDTLVPGVTANVLATMIGIDVAAGTAGTAYVAVLADGAATPTAAVVKAARAGSGGVTASARMTVNLTGLTAVTSYDVYIVVESNDGTFGRVMRLDVTTLRVADADSNGLIEIGTLAELNNVRYNLAGTSYRAGPGANPSTIGCPAGMCRGYELTANLDFDSDGDGGTWMRNSDGSFTLDAGDSHPDYFDTAAGGWVPIGDYFHRFTAVFDGAGHTISGLVTVRDLDRIGLFGAIGTGADIRNLGLVGNLAKYTGTSYTSVGGLVGTQFSGSIIASYAIGSVEGGDSDSGTVGGLVGSQKSGAITASYATGNADGGGGDDFVGGLVGYQDSGSIIASYATGNAEGGGGQRPCRRSRRLSAFRLHHCLLRYWQCRRRRGNCGLRRYPCRQQIRFWCYHR